MSLKKQSSTVVRIATHTCLLCYGLTSAKDYLIAVVGTDDRYLGHTGSFPFPTHETRSGMKLYPSHNEYISICCPASCSPYCCRTSPLVAFLLHTSCVQALLLTPPISMHNLWSFSRCIQPSHVMTESVNITHQIRTIVASLSQEIPLSIPPTIIPILQRMQQLPQEILHMILECVGSSLGLSLLTVHFDSLLLLQKKHPLAFRERQIELDCSKPVYVSYVMIRGRHHVSGISNEFCHGMHLLHATSKAEFVVIARDDLGICDIDFITQGIKVKSTRALWYQVEKLSTDSCNMVLVTTNTILVTDIVLKPQGQPRYIWDCPAYPPISPHQWYIPSSSALEYPFYMRRVDVGRDLGGLTVSYSHGTNMSFHTHDSFGQPSNPSFLDVESVYGDKLVWVYFPMSPGEKICGIWVITLLGGLARVAIYTTFRRSCIFGPYEEPARRAHFGIKSLNRSSDGHVTSLYYNDLRQKLAERVLQVAITSTKGTTIDVPKDPPWWPISSIPDCGRNIGQEWFYSNATLEGVQSIDICRHRTTGFCLGILLSYDDCTKAALGQWRSDHIIEAMDKYDTPRLLQFALDHVGSSPCVKDIRFNSPGDQRGWVTFAMRGRLLWWFNERSAHVVHEEYTEQKAIA